jgi:CheY-like chemotaxis protein
MPRKKMGEILLDNEIITQVDLEHALLRQKSSKKPIGKILEEMDVVLEEDIAKVLSEQFCFPYVKKFSRHKFSPELLKIIPAETALAHLIFPLKRDKKTLYLAMANPLDMAMQSDLSFKLGTRVSPCVATAAEIQTAIKKHYLADIQQKKVERTRNILLVDNHNIALTAAETALKKEGYAIYKATNGAEALKIAAQLQPDLIITDIPMPRMDGIELYRALQANREIAGVPVIALSSKNTVEDEYRLLEMGFFDFIAKPINPMRLLARVKRAIAYLDRDQLQGDPSQRLAFL